MWRLLFLIASLLFTRAVRADQPDVDRARELARSAGDMIDQQRWAEALDLATQAEALYHAPIHTFMSARALEGLGRLVDAMDSYEKVAAEALPAAAPQPFRDAQTEGRVRLNALLARVPSVLVRVAGAPRGVTVTLDGEALELAPDRATRVDPGAHVLCVAAPGYQPFSRSLTLVEHGGVVTVDVALQPVVAKRPELPSAPPIVAKPEPRSLVDDLVSNVPATVAFGVGASGLVVGTVTGLIFLDQLGDLHDACPDQHCAGASRGDIDATGTIGNVSTAAFAIGAAGIVTGAVLYALDPTSERSSAGTPSARRSGHRVRAGVAGIGGAF